jgi:hypothetical protein
MCNKFNDDTHVVVFACYDVQQLEQSEKDRMISVAHEISETFSP